MSPRKALLKAIEIVGGQAAMARALKISQNAVWLWVHRTGRCPLRWVIEIEKLTDGEVSRRDLAPEMYE